MFTFIAVMFIGIFVGVIFRKQPLMQNLAKPIQYTIFLLLFFMGISIGGNELIMQNLSTLGVQALLIAVAATLGSVVMGSLVYRYVLRKGKADEK